MICLQHCWACDVTLWLTVLFVAFALHVSCLMVLVRKTLFLSLALHGEVRGQCQQRTGISGAGGHSVGCLSAFRLQVTGNEECTFNDKKRIRAAVNVSSYTLITLDNKSC